MNQQTSRPAVRIVEVGPRDGLQNISKSVPTAVKVELIQRLVRAGLSTVEVTSFVSPKWIPQLSDNAEILRAIEPLLRDKNLSFPVLIPNAKGMDAALGHRITEVAVFVSASESFSQRNTNCSVSEALTRAREVAYKARQHGIAVRGYVSCVIECPYDGATAPAAVLHVARELLSMGCYEVSLGDTLGVGSTGNVETLLSVLLQSIPAEKLAGHFHDTYGQAVANVMKAYEMGLRTFDSSVAGLGGCPYAKGAKGNVATEDIVYGFQRLGVPTGVNLRELVATGQWISDFLDQPNGSRAGAALAARVQEQAPGRNNPPHPTTSTKVVRTAEPLNLAQNRRGVRATFARPKGN
ncbi:hypothetical protein M406DRAFT_354502 [Cryphonectria parasitica EP155]|uniref:hydroxymethylglutaryl-CoA lyase n=1 Tax=Cryphonectria parasitica (strain ATCC 38755 / EP155) TaxID=660469 RepID=A0A9P4YDB0_CRYP1|nr:uncharacterized protein M406DRAFT_354502 [Cryphonectria parasitica EP155]KAF3770550.1 hypothetical protein M406DRAFT_354502 [Cryphonectria parasitica EP155]